MGEQTKTDNEPLPNKIWPERGEIVKICGYSFMQCNDNPLTMARFMDAVNCFLGQQYAIRKKLIDRANVAVVAAGGKADE